MSRSLPGMRAVTVARAGERGAARDLGDLVKDVAAFVRQIAQRYEIALENMIVLAHSLAAVTVTAWVHDYAPPIRALILATAAFEVKLYVPLAIPALRLQQKLFGPGKVKSYVRAKMLTHDPVEAARYQADPLIFQPDSRSTCCSIFTIPRNACSRMPARSTCRRSCWPREETGSLV